MRALLLRGTNNKKKENYIDDLIKQNKIPLYNVERFDETLKILNAREIKRKLSVSSVDGRVIIIGKATIEAQNALLKVLEELPEKTYIIFRNDVDLLPTILSRCSIVNIDNSTELLYSVSEEDKKNALGFISNSISDSINSIDHFFSENTIEAYDRAILSLRVIMYEAINANETKTSRETSSLLKVMINTRGLLDLNNLNPRLAAEKAVLTIGR